MFFNRGIPVKEIFGFIMQRQRRNYQKLTLFVLNAVIFLIPSFYECSYYYYVTVTSIKYMNAHINIKYFI